MTDWSGAGDRNAGDGSMALRFVVLALATLTMGSLGYGTYELYPRFDLLAVDGLGLVVLAIAAATASFFSPCAFSLLLTIVGREAGPATAFVLLLGAVMAFGGSALVADVGVWMVSPAAFADFFAGVFPV